MKNTLLFLKIAFSLAIFSFVSCGDDEGEMTAVIEDPPPVSTVVLDPNQPPSQKLSDYKFFKGELKNQEPAYSVIPYEPISALFSDYALKKRFVWMPNGQKATYINASEILNFPIGTALIKNFYYNNVQPNNTTFILETRVMIKKEEGWIFAEYIWNDEQTEAFLNQTGDGVFKEITWIQNGTPITLNYNMPAESQCFTCHKLDNNKVLLGLEPKSLNFDYTYEDGTQNQLQKLIDFGYLEDNLPGTIETMVDWEDTSQPLEIRVRSYIDMNCASCHIEGGQAGYRGIRLAYGDTTNPENFGICEDPDTPIPVLFDKKIIEPGNAEESILYYRMSVSQEQYRMPQQGRQIAHEQALRMIAEWINSLPGTCD
ncbi:hypothetical protein ULMS_04240 [Patiriisocius marinistellae]|uniref:Cytochrome c domain-containing protein n=1 Tax=Patiriisocius marinistellae TaxID=2494560 RepID=A0A5J4FXP4_9FLAO|nr:hypothetical protein [Patiriisocius marinistellae]GEQ84916.1 hypothetical protein ULMS_04240 [Patiriisocius marinistellae]